MHNCMVVGIAGLERADIAEGYGVSHIWVTWQESERRIFGFSGCL